MADHVAVCKVQNDHIVLAGLDGLNHLIRDFVSAHFRLEVIRCNLRGLDKDAVLTRILLLDAAVEEECDMRILLGFGNAKLLEALIGDVLAEGVFKALRLECDLNVRHRGVILRHADVGEREEAILAGEAGEIRVYECAGDLSCAVRAEVEEHDGITGCDRSAALDDARHDELVRDFVFIGFRYSANRGTRTLRLRGKPWRCKPFLRAPNGCRGPSHSSAMTVATLPTPISFIFSMSSLTKSLPEEGGTSRPSSRA